MENLKRWVIDAGYTRQQLTALKLTQTPWKPPDDRCFLGAKLDENSALGVLIRLFFFGEPVPKAIATRVFPEAVLADFVRAEMLHEDSDTISANCMLAHFRDLLVACDSVTRARSGSVEDIVLV